MHRARPTTAPLAQALHTLMCTPTSPDASTCAVPSGVRPSKSLSIITRLCRTDHCMISVAPALTPRLEPLFTSSPTSPSTVAHPISSTVNLVPSRLRSQTPPRLSRTLIAMNTSLRTTLLNLKWLLLIGSNTFLYFGFAGSWL